MMKFGISQKKHYCQRIEKLEVPYQINPGEGAFYGPKLRICIKRCYR